MPSYTSDTGSTAPYTNSSYSSSSSDGSSGSYDTRGSNATERSRRKVGLLIENQANLGSTVQAMKDNFTLETLAMNEKTDALQKGLKDTRSDVQRLHRGIDELKALLKRPNPVGNHKDHVHVQRRRLGVPTPVDNQDTVDGNSSGSTDTSDSELRLRYPWLTDADWKLALAGHLPAGHLAKMIDPYSPMWLDSEIPKDAWDRPTSWTSTTLGKLYISIPSVIVFQRAWAALMEVMMAGVKKDRLVLHSRMLAYSNWLIDQNIAPNGYTWYSCLHYHLRFCMEKFHLGASNPDLWAVRGDPELIPLLQRKPMHKTYADTQAARRVPASTSTRSSSAPRCQFPRGVDNSHRYVESLKADVLPRSLCVCRNWNHGRCPTAQSGDPCRFGRRHVCAFCKSPSHRMSACKTNTRGTRPGSFGA